MGPLTMGLPLAVDPKKLGEFPQPLVPYNLG